MPDQRILQLLARKMANEATADELSELQDLLEKYPDGVYFEEILTQLWANPSANDDADLNIIYDQHKLKYTADFDLPEESKQHKIYTGTWRYMVAAVLLCLLISSAVIYYYNVVINKSGVTTTEIFAGKGIRKKVVLPDGTQVWLNGNSKLSFKNDINTNANRVVTLNGEAYFDVVKNKHRPFIIQTNKISIKVLGTAFNVKAYPDDNTTETSLIRGSIELTVSDNQRQKILLKPGEKFMMVDKKDGKVYATQPTDVPEKRELSIENIKPVEIESQQYIEETSWVNDKLVFKNESLQELVPKLERWYNVKIDIKNDAVYKYHFTGIFKNESITQALKAMQLIRPFNFKINNDEIEIN